MNTKSPNNSLILEAMREGVNYTFQIKCRKLTFNARPLSCFEVVKVTQIVADKLEELGTKYQNHVTESLALASEKLILASTSDVGANDAKLTSYEIERMSPDEVQFLFKQYLAGCERVNPCLEELSIEQVQVLVTEVKKNPNLASALIGLSFSQLVNICRHLLTTTDA